ncbi:hypothetical protein FOZ63_001773, partial [Perkinsus olseni]
MFTPSSIDSTFNGGALRSAVQKPSELAPIGNMGRRMDRIAMALWSSLSPSPSDQGPAATITPSSFHHLQLLTVHALLGGALTDAEGTR